MDPISALVNAGAAGAVIYTVRLFLEYIKTQNTKCTETLMDLARSIDRHTSALDNHMSRCNQADGNRQ